MIAAEAPYVLAAIGLFSFGHGIHALVTKRTPPNGDYLTRDEDWVTFDLSVGWYFLGAILCGVAAVALAT